jgi:hypothetical protein
MGNVAASRIEAIDAPDTRTFIKKHYTISEWLNSFARQNSSELRTRLAYVQTLASLGIFDKPEINTGMRSHGHESQLPTVPSMQIESSRILVGLHILRLSFVIGHAPQEKTSTPY